MRIGVPRSDSNSDSVEIWHQEQRTCPLSDGGNWLIGWWEFVIVNLCMSLDWIRRFITMESYSLSKPRHFKHVKHCTGIDSRSVNVIGLFSRDACHLAFECFPLDCHIKGLWQYIADYIQLFGKYRISLVSFSRLEGGMLSAFILTWFFIVSTFHNLRTFPRAMRELKLNLIKVHLAVCHPYHSGTVLHIEICIEAKTFLSCHNSLI